MRSRVNGYIERVRNELRESFTQDYTPREVAGSFSLGVFITMLPTLGVGLIVFVILSYLFDRINKIALFASVLVLNPPVKWGVYAASIALGVILLGPIDEIETTAVSLDAGFDVLVRLWVGNLILAVIATGIAYPAAYRMVTGYRDRELDVVGTTVETVIEGIEDIDWTVPLPTDEATENQPDDQSDESSTADSPDRTNSK